MGGWIFSVSPCSFPGGGSGSLPEGLRGLGGTGAGGVILGFSEDAAGSSR